MANEITEVLSECFPSESAVQQSMAYFKINIVDWLSYLRSFVCSVPPTSGTREGYQQAIARELEAGLGDWLVDSKGLHPAPRTYSPRLNEKPDLAVAGEGAMGRIFVEIEFRPNFEKDLVKFQIGWNSHTIMDAVLVVAIKRVAINPGYTTMPEYAKVLRTVRELNPPYPLLVVGLSGAHSTVQSELIRA